MKSDPAPYKQGGAGSLVSALDIGAKPYTCQYCLTLKSRLP